MNIMQPVTTTMPCAAVRFVKELYPRLKPLDDVVERYRDALGNLPPIIVARDGVLVDGYHRWQAHVREGAETIRVENIGNLTDAEIIRESIRRNSTHGQQLSRDDKRRMAAHLWTALADLSAADRVKDIASLLAVTERTVQEWTKEARKSEKEAQQAKAWELWLECKEQQAIAAELGISEATISGWFKERKLAEIEPPESRQHFDIWQFHTADDSGGQQSYFGALPPQVVENLLWFFTQPGDVVVDLFAGSGTTIDVAKAMGRRVWASDIRGNHYSPHLPIHKHDALSGWPSDAPKNADLVILDPPYWQQAKGRYSSERHELAEMSLAEFQKSWTTIGKHIVKRTKRIAFIISPTQMDDGKVIDHAVQMVGPFHDAGWRVERRIIVPYQTQQATGQQVTWARDNKRLLKLYRDLVVMSP